jgi:hypothetical protein
MFQKQTDQCSDVRSILKDELETEEKITLRLYQFDLGESYHHMYIICVGVLNVFISKFETI